ncbi:unnamed protein product, partial [Symbiodinium sp. CCMP2456]
TSTSSGTGTGSTTITTSSAGTGTTSTNIVTSSTSTSSTSTSASSATSTSDTATTTVTATTTIQAATAATATKTMTSSSSSTTTTTTTTTNTHTRTSSTAATATAAAITTKTTSTSTAGISFPSTTGTTQVALAASATTTRSVTSSTHVTVTGSTSITGTTTTASIGSASRSFTASATVTIVATVSSTTPTTTTGSIRITIATSTSSGLATSMDSTSATTSTTRSSTRDSSAATTTATITTNLNGSSTTNAMVTSTVSNSPSTTAGASTSVSMSEDLDDHVAASTTSGSNPTDTTEASTSVWATWPITVSSCIVLQLSHPVASSVGFLAALRWALAEVAGVAEEAVSVNVEGVFAECGRRLQQELVNTSEIVTGYEIRIPTSATLDRDSEEMAEKVRAALSSATKTDMATKLKEAFLSQPELAEVAVMVSMMGEPILEVLQTTPAGALSSSTESRYPSLVPEAITIGSASASILASVALILCWRRSAKTIKTPTCPRHSGSGQSLASFVGVSPADTNATSMQSTDAVLNATSTCNEPLPEAVHLSPSKRSQSEAQPESCKQVHSPRTARRKVWRAVPILRREHGDEEASRKSRGKRTKARRLVASAQPVSLQSVVVEDTAQANEASDA